MRSTGWTLPILVTFALTGMMYGATVPGEQPAVFDISALLLMALTLAWLVAVVRQLTVSGEHRNWFALVASPALVLTALLLIHAGVPLQLRWYTAEPAFTQALRAFERDPAFGRNPGQISGYPIEYITRRADNFVDFTYRNDQNGWDGITYSADGSEPRTVHHSAGNYVIHWAQRLGAHWFAFEGYQTVS